MTSSNKDLTWRLSRLKFSVQKLLHCLLFGRIPMFRHVDRASFGWTDGYCRMFCHSCYVLKHSRAMCTQCLVVVGFYDLLRCTCKTLIQGKLQWLILHFESRRQFSGTHDDVASSGSKWLLSHKRSNNLFLIAPRTFHYRWFHSIIYFFNKNIIFLGTPSSPLVWI